MSVRDWQAFDAELRARLPELAVDLLGQPSSKTGLEWRWGRKGSLAIIVSGPKAGMWFDHEAGDGSHFADLVGRKLGMARSDVNDWIADRIGVADRHQPAARRAGSGARTANNPDAPSSTRGTERPETPPKTDTASSPARVDDAATRAKRLWTAAHPAPEDHPYLVAKRAKPLALRMDAGRRLIVPLQDVDGNLQSLEFIASDGAKRYLAGGAKKGHFAVVGAEPGPLEDCRGPVLICEGWATGASLHIATGHTVIAAMDAGNLLPVAQALHARFPDADYIVVADNDVKPDRDTNPGLVAARTLLEIDLLTDVVLPVTVDTLVAWSDLRPTRRDLMALKGIMLENAADMAACFPELWPSADAARQDRVRSVTNCYYRDFYNSQMSHSSTEVTYRPAGPGHRARTARVDLTRIPDPETWLTNRLGPLAAFDIVAPRDEQGHAREQLGALASRLTASMQAMLTARRATLDALAARLQAVAAPHPPSTPTPKEEN